MSLQRGLVVFIFVLAVASFSCAEQPEECADLDGTDRCAARSDCTEYQALAYDLETYRTEYGDDDPEDARPCPSALNYERESVCVSADWSQDETGDPTNVGRNVGGQWRIYRLEGTPENPERSGFVECPRVHAELGESTAWEVCAYCTP